MPRISPRCLRKKYSSHHDLNLSYGATAAMRVASGLHRRVEGDRVRVVLGAPACQHGRQVGAAAEPGLRGDDEAGVHVHRRHVRVVQVGDERNAGGEKARVVGGAGNLLAEFRREFAEHGRDVHADLLEYAALHHRHDAAAARRAAVVGAVPGRAHEAAGARSASGAPAGRASSSSSNAATIRSRKRFEPGAGALFAGFDLVGVHGLSGRKSDNEGVNLQNAIWSGACTDCHKSGRVSVLGAAGRGRIMPIRLTPNPLTRRRLLAGAGSYRPSPRRGAVFAAACRRRRAGAPEILSALASPRARRAPTASCCGRGLRPSRCRAIRRRRAA